MADQFWGEAIGGSTAAPVAKGFWGEPVGSRKAAPAIAVPQPAAPPEEPPEALPDEPIVIPRGYQRVPGKTTLQPIDTPPAAPAIQFDPSGPVPGTERTGLPGPPAPPQAFVPPHRNAIAYQGYGTYSPEFQQAATQFGAEHPLEPGAAPLEPIAGRVRGVLRGAQGLAELSPPPPGKPRDTDTTAQGISDLLGGTFETLEPLAGVGAVAAPAGTAATYVLATGAQKGVEAVAKKSGASPKVAKAAGDVAATVVGGIGAHRIGQGIWEAAGKPEITVGGVRITPEGPPSGPQPSKPFGEMTDQELIDHRNAIERDPPRNYDWQKEQIVQEAARRQAERGVGQPEQPAEGDVFWGNPVLRETEADIARQEAEETARRSTDPVRDLMATLHGVDLPPEPEPPVKPTGSPPAPSPEPPGATGGTKPPGGSPGEPGVVKFEDLESTPVPENHVRIFDHEADVYRDLPVDPNPLTPHTVLEQWGSLKPGQVVHSEEGPLIITRTDRQNSDVPRITVQDQQGRSWIPTKPQLEEWVSQSGQPSGPTVGTDVGQAPTEPGAAGHDAEVYTIKGRQVPVRYEVREAGDLTNSFEQGYPQEFQPRQTDRAGSRQRIEQRKADMTGPLMADSRLASDGAPIILPDGTVITRNHGTQALKELYGENKPRAQEYKQWLTENAEQFGIDPQHVAGMERPVLTRVMTEPMTHGDIVTFAQEANMSSAARMSDAEMASELAKRMTGPLMESFDPDEKGRPNLDFVRGLIQDLPVEEQSVFLDKGGQLSQTGARMVRDAIFAKAYPDPRAVERMAESESDSLKNITAGMLQAAPQVARFQEGVERGERFDLGLGGEISDAAAVLENLQKKGLPVSDWLKQGILTPRDQVIHGLVKMFSEQRKSAKKIGDVLKEYHKVAEDVGDPRQQGMFGAPEPVSKDDILRTAYERARANWSPAAKKDVFGDEAAPGEREERGLASRAGAEKGPARGRSEEEEPQALAARKPKGPAAGQEGLFPAEEEPPKQTALELAQEKHRAQVEENKAKLTGKREGAEEPLLEGHKGVRVEGTTREKLLGEQLTAQMKSGMAMKPAKLKPAETRGMFEEEEPETGMLFARRPVSEWKPGTDLDRIDSEKLNIPKEGKRLRIEDVMRYLQTQTRNTLGRVPKNAKQATKLARLLDLARKELQYQLSLPNAQSGIGFYGKDTRIADRDMAQVFPELEDKNGPLHILQKAISAASSNNTNPQKEAFNSASHWDETRKPYLVNGEFQIPANGRIQLPMVQPNGKKWSGRGLDSQLAKMQRMINDLGVKGFADWMRSLKTGREIKQYVPNARGLKVNEKYPGALVLGPKIGQYFMDLMGIKSTGTTVDVWDTRAHQRRLGTLFDKNGEMISAPESVFDRPLFSSIHAILGKEFGLKPKDVQSLLWHYEQALYRALGMGSRSYKRSDGTLAFLRSKGLDRISAPRRRPGSIDQRGPRGLLERSPGDGGGDREPTALASRGAPVGEGQQEPDHARDLQRGGEGRPEGPLERGGQRPPAAENILFGSGNPVSEASEPSSPLTGSSDSTIPPPKGEVNTLESRRPTPGKVPEQMELFPNHVTTPEMTEHPPARTTAFEVNPDALPRFQDAHHPSLAWDNNNYWKQMQAQGGDLGGRPALFVNNVGMDAFLKGAGILDAPGMGNSSNVNGLAIKQEFWKSFLANAKILRDRYKGFPRLMGEREKAIVQLADEVEKAAKDGEPLILIQTGHTKAPEKIKVVAEEEYDHVSQYALPGGLQGLPIAEVLATAEGRAAADGLARNYGYPSLSGAGPAVRAQIVAEIGVRLMRPGLYQNMNLSAQQAFDLAKSFMMELKARHGDKAASMVDQFHAASAKNQAPLASRSGDLQTQHQEGAPNLGGTGGGGPGQVPPDALSRGRPESEPTLQSRQPARQPGSPAYTKRLNEQNEKQYGFNVRNWFTGRRDVWQARVNQVLEGLRKTLPDPIDQEALAIYRDFKDRPGELKQFLEGTHEAYGEVRDLDIAKQNIEQLRTPIERAMNPSDAMKEADQKLTAIAAASLAEGKRVGFIDQHVKPEQYVTHLLERPSAEEPSKFEDMGRAIGGKMGLYFPYAQERAFPTLLHAAANNFKPRTLNAFTAFQTYGDKFATVRASHLLMHQLHDSHVGMWGVKGNKGIPEGWKPLAPHSDIFRKTIAIPGAEGGEPEAAELRLFVPKVIDDALRPITDPDYTARIKGFRFARAWQAYTKAAQLGLSFFHAISLNYGGLANMGPRGYAQAWKALMKGPLEPGFHSQELDLIQHGGTTPVQGKVYEKFSSVEPTSFPTLGERIRQLPGLKQVDRVSGALTDLTFGKIQRTYKVIDYSLHKAAWLAKNPKAEPGEYHAAMRSIAKELNSVYGGLHWENLGVNKSTLEVMRFGMLAPDWAFSNWFQAKYAFEKTPAGAAARRYWLRAVLFGLGMTQAMSLMMSRQASKRPTQVYMGKDKEGKDVYQNMFFKGAVGDAANLAYNVKDFGFPVGIARTLGNKVAPGIRTAIELSRNETYLGQPIAAKGLNPLVSTIRGGANIATGLMPIPWSAANVAEMMMNRDKYNLPTEALTTLFAGTPPAHVKAQKDRETQSLWEQMKTGKPYATTKRGSEEEKLGRELQRLTK